MRKTIDAIVCLIIYTLAIASFCFAYKVEKKDYNPSVNKIKVIVENEARQQAEKDDNWKQVIERLEDKDIWKGYFKRIDEQLGIHHKDGLPITVTLKENNTYPRRGMGSVRGRGGELWMSVPALIKSVPQAKDVDLGGIDDIVVIHELIHCLQQSSQGEDLTRKWPEWLIEGMADFAAYDKPLTKELKVLEQVANSDLDSAKGAPSYMRLRGWLFFTYLKETFKEGKVKEFVGLLLEKTSHKDAVEKATKKRWDEFKADELKWAKEYINKK